MDLSTAKTILKEHNYNVIKENTNPGDCSDWYTSNARKALEDYLLDKIIGKIEADYGFTAEQFWNYFSNKFYMDYTKIPGEGTIQEWVDKAANNMASELKYNNEPPDEDD